MGVSSVSLYHSIRSGRSLTDEVLTSHGNFALSSISEAAEVLTAEKKNTYFTTISKILIINKLLKIITQKQTFNFIVQ